MELGTIWHIAVTGVKGLMAVIPNVPWWYFPVFVIPAIWAVFLGGLFVYINIMGREDERTITRFTNFLWLANALAMAAFILTRESLLHDLGWLLVSILIFWFSFANFAVAYQKLWPSEIWWKKWLGGAIAVGILWWGFPYDVCFNLTWGRLMFWQKPRLFDPNASSPWRRVFGGDYTLTATLKRNIREGLVLRNGKIGYLNWRGAEAYFICTKMVEPWHPNHCGLAQARASTL